MQLQLRSWSIFCAYRLPIHFCVGIWREEVCVCLYLALGIYKTCKRLFCISGIEVIPCISIILRL